jgi:hypothetical protein
MSHFTRPLSLKAVAFRTRVLIGLVLSKNGNAFVCLPSDISLGEAKLWFLETGPLHDFLEKGCK